MAGLKLQGSNQKAVDGKTQSFKSLTLDVADGRIYRDGRAVRLRQINVAFRGWRSVQKRVTSGDIRLIANGSRWSPKTRIAMVFQNYALNFI